MQAQMDLAITSIQRNRGPWIMEWLAFHMVVGFNRFFLYAHQCDDDTVHLLLRLAQQYPIVLHQVPPASAEVPLVRLDNARFPRAPTLIKIEVEGLVLQVLRGAVGFLDQPLPATASGGLECRLVKGAAGRAAVLTGGAGLPVLRFWR